MASDTLPWTLKYEPQTLSEISFYQPQIQQMKLFVETFKKQKRKAMLIHGPTGCGKTAAVHALAHDSGLELIEINASDCRNKDAILSIIGTAAKQRSLFFSSKIILIDEIDGLAGNQDRGGISALEDVIDTTEFPIFLTCQDVSDKKIKSLLKKSQVVAFEPHEYTLVTEVLKKICAVENISYDESALKTLARQADGDLRAAINDIQSLGNEKITLQRFEELGYRNKRESIQDALIKVFKISDANIAKTAFQSVQEDIDHIFLWVDENLPKEYTDAESLAQAYEYLSRADVFKGRIRRWQHWGFLVYIDAFLSAGVAVSKKQRNKNPIVYEQTQRLLKIWIAKQKYAKRQAIAEKLTKAHMSSHEALDSVIYIKQMFKNKEMKEKLIAEFDFDTDEVTWLTT
ncbi:MAG: replication factor C large subunit [Candidatus Woesearchaeota archaeon]